MDTKMKILSLFAVVLGFAHAGMCKEVCEVIELVNENCSQMCQDSEKVLKCFQECDKSPLECFEECSPVSKSGFKNEEQHK